MRNVTGMSRDYRSFSLILFAWMKLASWKMLHPSRNDLPNRMIGILTPFGYPGGLTWI